MLQAVQCTRRACLNNFWRLQDGVDKTLRFQSAARTAEAVHPDLQARAAADRRVSWSGLAAVAACEVGHERWKESAEAKPPIGPHIVVLGRLCGI